MPWENKFQSYSPSWNSNIFELCCSPSSEIISFLLYEKNMKYQVWFCAKELSAVTKSGTGTWDLRTRGCGDTGTWGCGRRAGTQGHDKQTTPEFYAEFVKYNFWRSSVR